MSEKSVAEAILCEKVLDESRNKGHFELYERKPSPDTPCHPLFVEKEGYNYKKRETDVPEAPLPSK